jgi:uncharacterized protein (TIGR04255 family)
MFPETAREIFRKRPSEEVICQLRFPTILRIDAEAPASFQESIRNDYPNFQERPNLGLPLGVPPQLSRLFGPEFSFGAGKVYEFSSSDRNWTVNLDRDSLAVTTRAYERWEGFKDRLRVPFEALCTVYRPRHFSRIGLRYRDMIRRDKLDLATVSWAELLSPHIAAEFASPVIADHIQQAAHQVVIRDPNGTMQVFLQHGLAQPNPETRNAYFIDSDFSVETETRIENALATLDAFNTDASRLFRWCITKRLHDALDPEPA